jgi:hypothetical protein
VWAETGSTAHRVECCFREKAPQPRLHYDVADNGSCARAVFPPPSTWSEGDFS